MRYPASALALAALLAAGACSHSPSSTVSPTAPSSDASSPAPSTSGATLSGQVTASTSGGPGVSGGVTVSVAGTNRTAVVDGAGRFKLDDVAPGTIELQFAGAGLDVRLGIGEVERGEKVEMLVSIEGASGTLSALSHLLADGRADVRGVISAVDASSRSLRVGSTAITVPSTASIKANGQVAAFERLAVQQRVHIQGSITGGVVTAREVEIEGDRGRDDDGENEAEFKGTITSIGGACPALSISVAGRTVRTTAATAFLEPCGQLSVGQTVEIKGATQPDGTVAASRVHIEGEGDEDEDEMEAEFRGTATSVGGNCPSLTMIVAGRTVRTSGATAFERGGCAAIKPGMLLQVKGATGSDGSVTATRVRIED